MPPLPLPDVSVIVPVHGDRGLLDRTLDCLDGQLTRCSFEVLVVDNGDNADLADRLARRRPPARGDRQLRLLTETRPGSYAARNAAVRVARAPVFAFTDADCLPRPGWLQAGHEALERAGAGSWVGGSISLRPRRPGRLTLPEVWQVGHDLRQDRYVASGWAATANLFVRAADFAAVGPFDAELKSGGDKNWGLRATAAGIRGVYAVEAAIDHPTRPTLGEFVTKRRRVSQGSVDLAVALGQPVHAAGVVRALRPPLRATWDAVPRQPLRDLDRARLVAVTAATHVAQRAYEHRRWSAAQRGTGTASLIREGNLGVGPVEAPPAADATPEVSVVIPTLNGARTLPVQLAALARQRTSRTFEVIVADNGSTDGTAGVVAEWAGRLPGLRLVDAGARTGSNVARNVGTAAARAEAVLLCDSDDEVHEDWLQTLAAALASADGVGGTLEIRRLNPRYAAAPSQPASVSGVVTQLGFLPRPTGANAGFRRSVWDRLGGFDERYVRGGTETEFFWRLQLTGHSFAEVPDAVVSYRLREDRRRSLRQMYVWGRQHAMLYREFHDHGLASDAATTIADLARTARIAVTLPWHPERRMELTQRVVYRAGRVAGSWHYRVVFP